MKNARIVNNVVVEFLTPIDGFELKDCFHEDVLASIIQVGDEVQLNWVVNADGSVTETAKTEEQMAAEKAAKDAAQAELKAKQDAAVAAAQAAEQAAAQTAPTGPTGV